jgi:ribose transport system substrate-binding protein
LSAEEFAANLSEKVQFGWATNHQEVFMRTLRFTAVLSFASLGLVTGCGRHSNKETYYLISNNMDLSYWKTAVAGFEKAAAQYDVTAKIDGPKNFDVQEELKDLHDAIATHPNGILISVADATVLQPEINDAIDKNIPVITIDSDAPHSHRLFFIGTNNLEAGHLGGQRLVNKLGGKGNVVFFTNTGQPNLDERLKGYEDILSLHPGIKEAEVFNIKGSSENAFDKTQEYLARTGDKRIDAFVCLEASSGKDVATVLKNNKVTDRLLIAMDVDPDTLQGIKDGLINATIAQKPFTMGYYGLRALDQIYHNPPAGQLHPDYSQDSFSPFPVFIDTGTAEVDKNNVDIYVQSATEAQQK